MDPQRTLTDDDVKAVAKAVLDEAIKRWYMAAGQSFTKMVTFVCIAAIAGLALWFYIRGK